MPPPPPPSDPQSSSASPLKRPATSAGGEFVLVYNEDDSSPHRDAIGARTGASKTNGTHPASNGARTLSNGVANLDIGGDDRMHDQGDLMAGWENWVNEYRSGRWHTGDGPPVPPPAIVDILEGSSQLSSERAPSGELNLYPATAAKSLLDFYKSSGYLPAPMGKYQDERIQLMRKYGLDAQERKTAIDRICSCAAIHFQTKMVLISLVFDTHQVLAAETGWDPTDPGLNVPLRSLEWNSSLCPHAMTLDDPNDTFILEDASADWRFKKNPFSQDQGGPLAFYASANIRLPTTALHSSPPTAYDLSMPPTLPVGSVCLIDDKPRKGKDFSAADRKLLHSLADMVAREFQLGFEQLRRTTESRQTEYLSSFLTSALVFPDSGRASVASPKPQPSQRAPVTSATEAEDLSHPRLHAHAYRETAQELRRLTDCQSIGILDLRSFRAPRDTSAGGIIVGSLLRQRALEADRAKLAQLELIREFSSPEQLAKLTPFLDVADVCLESLRDVLDDTLDFGKLANSMPETAGPVPTRSLVQADLEKLAGDVAKACWVRKERVDSITAEATGKGSQPAKGKVDVILEVDRKVPSWLTYLDVGGMKRVLLNLVGNSLKFTREGHVSIRIREMLASENGAMTPTGQRLVAIDIEDTGCGIGEDFLRDGKLWLPFIQEDPFANGAGLGMSICDTLVKRMGGKIDVMSQVGKGTTIRVTLPLTFVVPVTVDDPNAFFPAKAPTNGTSDQTHQKHEHKTSYRRRIISDELGTLLATPGEKPAFDFSQSNSLDSPAFALELPSIEPFTLSPPEPRAAKIRLAPISPPLDSPGTPGTPGSQDATTPKILSAGLGIDGNASTPTTMAGKEVSPTPPSVFPFPAIATPKVASVGEPEPVMETTPMSPPAPASAPAQPSAAGPTSLFPDVNVLVADDNVIARNIMAKLFGGKHVKFSLAEDGQIALDKYKEGAGSYNLCCLDVQMPHKDGVQTAFEIRAFEKENNLPRCKIIVLSGISNEQDIKLGLGEAPGHPGQGPVDIWTTKGGKSLSFLMGEVKTIQDHVYAGRLKAAA
ncbi:hypothetical protein MNV49_000511 [Pseudohyphozyma bogoriensis]|nr:hypothetical protein MNV49_000511 [Pseudohyphozyma bogoriensis]